MRTLWTYKMTWNETIIINVYMLLLFNFNKNAIILYVAVLAIDELPRIELLEITENHIKLRKFSQN